MVPERVSASPPLLAEGETVATVGVPSFRLVLLVPAQAATLLQQRRPSARINAAAVRSYAEAMRTGRWILNGMPVILSQHGMLLDGLQRLAACVEAGVPFSTFIAENIADDVLHT